MIRAPTTRRRRRFLLLVSGAAQSWSSAVSLRGPPPVRRRLRDYFNGRDLGEVDAPGAALPLTFDRFLRLETMPV